MDDKVTALHGDVKQIGFQLKSLHDTMNKEWSAAPVSRDQVVQWVDAIFTHNEYERALIAHVEGTCTWILHRKVFHNWIDQNSSSSVGKILWIRGYPGFGKTVMAASLTRELEQTMLAASFFCFFGDERKRQPLSILRSWIAQLVQSSDDALKLAKEPYLLKKLPKATETDLWSLFKRLCVGLGRFALILDGFDECVDEQIETRSHVLLDARQRFVKNLEESIENTDVLVLILSRESSELRNRYRRNLETISTLLSWSQYEISREDTYDDIQSYAKVVVEQRLPRKSEELKQDIAERLVRKSHGMFLYISRIQARIMSSMGATKLRSLIDKVPSGLDEAYERDLERIIALEEDDKERALAILRWTLFARFPLTVRELTEALLVPMNENEPLAAAFPSEDLPDEWNEDYINEQIIGLCGSLVDLRGAEAQRPIKDQTVNFVHYTIKEYLVGLANPKIPLQIRALFKDESRNHEMITETCLRYMCYLDFKQSNISTEEQFTVKMATYDFLYYAANHWEWHADKIRKLPPNVIWICNQWLDPAARRWLSYAETTGSHIHSSFENFLVRLHDFYPDPLYYASYHGLVPTMQFLIDQGADVNKLGGEYGTPLQAAAVSGHVDGSLLLLQNGADVNLVVSRSYWGVPLQAAVYEGHEAVVEVLLDHRADVHAKGGWFDSSILAASAHHGQGDYQSRACRMIHRLLGAGAKIDETSPEGENALHLAAAADSLQVIGLLLQLGLDINFQTQSGITPLCVASVEGKAKAVEYILEHGASVNLADIEQLTPLHRVSRKGYHTIVRMLLTYGAEIHGRSRFGWTPLHLAAEKGHDSVIQLLLDHVADTEASTGNIENTSLGYAVDQGHTRALELLLAPRWHDPLALSHALLCAMIYGYQDAARLLIDGGANLNGWSEEFTTHLLASVTRQQHKMTEFLIDRGADIKATNKYGYTALMKAAEGGYGLIEFLLRHVSFIEAMNQDGDSALHLATRVGEKRNVELLLGAGAFIDQQGGLDRQTPLCVAIHHAKFEIIAVLLREGADPSHLDIYGRNCYDWACACRWGYDLKPLLPKPPVIPSIQAVTDARRYGIIAIIGRLRRLVGGYPDPLQGTIMVSGHSTLGKLLLLQGMDKDACAAFAFSLDETFAESSVSQNSTSRVAFTACCDSCDVKSQSDSTIFDTRFTCRSCIDIDLCTQCMEEYNANGKWIKMDTRELCRGHDYLEVPASTWGLKDGQRLNQDGETAQQWLDRLLRLHQSYSPVPADGSEEETLAIRSRAFLDGNA